MWAISMSGGSVKKWEFGWVVMQSETPPRKYERG